MNEPADLLAENLVDSRSAFLLPIRNGERMDSDSLQAFLDVTRRYSDAMSACHKVHKSVAGSLLEMFVVIDGSLGLYSEEHRAALVEAHAELFDVAMKMLSEDSKPAG